MCLLYFFINVISYERQTAAGWMQERKDAGLFTEPTSKRVLKPKPALKMQTCIVMLHVL